MLAPALTADDQKFIRCFGPPYKQCLCGLMTLRSGTILYALYSILVGIIGIIYFLFLLGISIAIFEGILDPEEVQEEDQIEPEGYDNDDSVMDEDDDAAAGLFFISIFCLIFCLAWTIIAVMGLHGMCTLQHEKMKHFSIILNFFLVLRMVGSVVLIIALEMPVLHAIVFWFWNVGLEYYFAKIVWSAYIRLIYNEVTVVVHGPNVLVGLSQDSSRAVHVQMV